MGLFLFFLLVGHALAIKTDPKEDFYNAAVVEFCPYEGRDANDTMTKNAMEYVRLIEKAAQEVDIIVFPEYGLSNEYDTLFLEIPFGMNQSAPADNPKLHHVIRMLSKAARDYEIYVSICLLEKDLSSGEELRYNTNIVFDRKGVVISKYRKFNLYDEKVNRTETPDIAIFQTDFGVRFGVFICADIFHKTPALILAKEYKVKDFIYPNWFYAELKLGISVQIQFGWAYMTDSNLLSSGMVSLEQGSTGSGIFAGRNGTLVNIISERNETRLLTATVHKKDQLHRGESSKRNPAENKKKGRILEPLTPGVDSTHEIGDENFDKYLTDNVLPFRTVPLIGPYESYYKSHLIEKTFHMNEIFLLSMISRTVYCEFRLNVTYTLMPKEYLNRTYISDSYLKNDSYYHYLYKFAAFDGIKGFPDKGSKGIQVCAIIPCLDFSEDSCGVKKTAKARPIDFQGYSTMRSAVYRNIMRKNLFLFSTKFNRIGIKSVSLKDSRDFTFPNLLDSSTSSSIKAFGSPPDVSRLVFKYNDTEANFTYSSDRLVYAGLYSRIISRDGIKDDRLQL